MRSILAQTHLGVAQVAGGLGAVLVRGTDAMEWFEERRAGEEYSMAAALSAFARVVERIQSNWRWARAPRVTVALPWRYARVRLIPAVERSPGPTSLAASTFPRFWTSAVLGPAWHAHTNGLDGWLAVADEDVTRQWDERCTSLGLVLAGVVTTPHAIARAVGLRGGDARSFQWLDRDLVLRVEVGSAGELAALDVREHAPREGDHPDLSETSARTALCAALGAAMLEGERHAGVLALERRRVLDAPVAPRRMALATAVFGAALLASAAAPGIGALMAARSSRAADESARANPDAALAQLGALEEHNLLKQRIHRFSLDDIPASVVLATLSEALPDECTVLSLLLTGRAGTAVLLAPDASGVVAALARAKGIRAPMLAGPVVPVDRGPRADDTRVRLVVRFAVDLNATGKL